MHVCTHYEDIERARQRLVCPPRTSHSGWGLLPVSVAMSIVIISLKQASDLMKNELSLTPIDTAIVWQLKAATVNP